MTATRLPAAERRRQLRTVALRLFARHGFHEVSMNDLAAEAGVTKPVVYQHFPNKQALYLELVDDVRDRLVTSVRTATREASGPQERLRDGLAAYFRVVADERQAFSLLFGGAAPADPALGDAARATERAMVEVVAEMVQGVDPALDAELVAHALVGAAEGAVRRMWGSEPRPTPDELADQTAALLWGGLGQRYREG